jgi:hypothetical protein
LAITRLITFRSQRIVVVEPALGLAMVGPEYYGFPFVSLREATRESKIWTLS